MVAVSGSLVSMIVAATWTGLYLSTHANKDGTDDGNASIKSPMKTFETISPNSISHYPRSIYDDNNKNRVIWSGEAYDYNSDEFKDNNDRMAYTDESKTLKTSQPAHRDSTINIVLLKSSSRDRREDANSGV